MDNPGLAYIRQRYRVPAFVGVRVEYAGCDARKGKRGGEIIGASGPYLRVRFDDGPTLTLHPTWKIKYDDPGLMEPVCD